MHTLYTKLVNTTLTGALFLGLVGGLIPYGALAQTTSATVNFAGKVTAVNVSANSISVEVRWLYGVAASQSSSQTSVLPIAAYYCPGKIITVQVPSSAKLIDFRGKPITLAQVQTGVYFNATSNWQNGVNTAQVVRFQRTPSPAPTPPKSFTIAPPAVATSTPPTTTTSGTVINFAGKVTATNATTSSFSGEVQWFYGGYAAQNILFPIAGRLCPGTIVTIKVPSTVKLIDFTGQPIALSQVKIGVYFNATVLWQNGLLTAQTIRFQKNLPPPPSVPAQSSISLPPSSSNTPSVTTPPSPTPSSAPAVAPSSVPQTSVSETKTQSPAPAPCTFWARLFRRC